MINDKNKLVSFGHVLVTMGKVDEAEIYYRRLLDELSPDHQDFVHCYEGLAAVADEKKKYDDSLQWYEKALEINMKASNKQHDQNLNIASNYNGMGDIYRKKGDLKNARKYYDRALETLGDNLAGKSLAKQAACFNSIGIVYQDEKQYQEALDYYRKASEIRQKHFPSVETSLGKSYNNIGNAYYFLRCYKDAIYYYQEALKIYERTLPPQHPKIASTYNNIGATYDDQGNLADALSHYEYALKIYRNTYPGTHENVTKIEENIQRIQSKMSK